jgi:hypothetical protein
MTTMTTATAFNRTAARKFMRSIAEEHRDENGEINHTSLAEAIAARFDADGEGGPLDDPDHWIWEVALEVE